MVHGSNKALNLGILSTRSRTNGRLSGGSIEWYNVQTILSPNATHILIQSGQPPHFISQPPIASPLGHRTSLQPPPILVNRGGVNSSAGKPRCKALFEGLPGSGAVPHGRSPKAYPSDPKNPPPCCRPGPRTVSRVSSPHLLISKPTRSAPDHQSRDPVTLKQDEQKLLGVHVVVCHSLQQLVVQGSEKVVHRVHRVFFGEDGGEIDDTCHLTASQDSPFQVPVSASWTIDDLDDDSGHR